MNLSPRSRRLGLALGGIYLVVLAVIALAPDNVDAGVYPFLLRTLARLSQLGAPDWLTYSAVEFGANILLFVPLGAFVALLLGPRRWLWAVAVGVAASVAIEVAQGLFLSNRVATVRDVVANGVGALLGAVLAVALLMLVRARRRSHPDPDPDAGDQPIV